MRFCRCSLIVLLVSLTGAGCQKSETNAGPPTVADASPTNAQPMLPTVKLWLGSQELITEIARTPAQMATGMMFRKQMAENEGMLFVFPQPLQASFYMRNTLIPLSCAYLDNEGVILEIHDMKPLEEAPIVASTDRIQFVLETRQGWFPRNQVAVGAVVRTERGSLRETFFGRR